MDNGRPGSDHEYCLQSRISGNFPSPNPAGLNLLEIPIIESNNLKDSRDNYPAM